MTPICLTMKGFQSFRDEFTFYFPTAPGLYFLRGDNQLEPRLGGNGAGKSTLWAALYWLCFETTPKGLRAGNVANWDTGRGVEVVFQYEHEGSMFGVRRTWGPNSWTMLTDYQEPGKHGPIIDLVKSTENPFLAHLKLGPSAFLHCILMAQRREMFLDLKPEAKVSLLTDVLGLDAWIDRSAQASKKAQEQDRVSRMLEQRVADLEGQLRAHTATDYAAQAAEWDKACNAKLDELTRQHGIAIKVEKEHAVVTDRAKLLVDSLRTKVRAAQTMLNELQTKQRESERAIDRIGISMEASKSRAAVIRTDMEALKSMKCPECGQPVPLEQVQDKLQKLADELAQTNKKMIADRLETTKERAALQQAAEALASASASVNGQREALITAERELSGHQRALQYVTRDLDRIEDEAERLEAETNPFTQLQAERLEDVAGLQQRLADAKSDLDDSTTEHALKLMWVRGFKEIRLFDMANALTALEVEVNSSVSEMGLQDWSINFALDRETARGDVKRGFSVFVQSPANKKPVPWEAWSGGESQRLRLSGTCGLSDLIRSQSGCNLGLEVWDEPTDGLSPQGITDLLEALKARAQREHRQVWVVDHHALGYGAFDGVYTVVKDATGSHIVEE